MKLDAKLRWHLKLQNGLFAVLFLALTGLLGYLSHDYRQQWDITQNSRNTLSAASRGILKQLAGPVRVTAYATPQDPKLGDIRRLIREALAPYLRAKKDFTLRFIDPADQPQQARAAGVKLNGELVVEYAGRSEHLTTINEQEVSNLLMRLARSGERQVFYLDGHGERKLDGGANFDLGDFGAQLRTKGFKIAPLNLGLAQQVPANASLLVISQPQVDLLPGEITKLLDFIDRGGNLLWLVDPEPLHGLQPLAEKVGIALSAGTVVDPAAQQMRLPATVALGTSYGYHAVTRNFTLLTAFPSARMVSLEDRKDWHGTTLVEVAQRGWVETGSLDGNISFDRKRDIPGPVPIAVALERQQGDKDQRVAVIGSGAFLSNTFLGNGGNLDLGVNLVNWLAHDDRLIAIQPRPNVDGSLKLSRISAGIFGLGFLVVLPLLFLIAGVVIWRRRR
ncbi:MAG: GldG family protein [Burkholderiales bacterium]